VAASDYAEDLRIDYSILEQHAESYRKVRNTFRYILGNLNDKFEKIDLEKINIKDFPELEQYMLHKIYKLSVMFEKNFEKYNFHTIYKELLNFCNSDLSAFYFDIRKDTLYCDDLKSQKIWTWAGDYKTAKLWDEAGFNAIPLSVPDVHSSLQTGLVNAMAFPPLYVAANQYFGITSNMLNMKWGILTAALVIDLKIWNRIKPKYQNIMQKVSDEIGLEYQLNNRKEEDDAVEVMKEYGLKVNNLSPEQLSEWNMLVESMYPLIRGNIVQEEIFDRVIKLKNSMPSAKNKNK